MITEKLSTILSSLNQTDDFEQYGRRSSLRFHNVPAASSEQISDTDSVIINLCKEKLNVEISENDIDRSHILGSINREGKVLIICRFRNWKIKNKIYRAKTKLKGKTNKSFIRGLNNLSKESWSTP